MMPLNMDQMRHCAVALLALALTGLTIGSVPTSAQNAAKPSTEKWRPKDGTYANPGKDFDNDCRESYMIFIELTEKAVAGDEWGCNVTGLVDTAPGAIRLSMICDNYNLAGRLKLPENTRFKETMLLRKIDDKTIFIHRTTNGKFSGPGGRVAYCPEEVQRADREAKESAKAEAARKAEQERLSRSDHPRDGVYAAPDEKFDEQCAKFGDAVVELAKQLISVGPNKCKIRDSKDQYPDIVRLTATCTENPGPSFTVSPDGHSATVQSVYDERVMLKKTDDNTIRLWVPEDDGYFRGPGRELRYCSDQIQRAYAGRNTKK